MYNKIESLRPFTRFLMTIGELPTSYLVSMTYEEQLLWLCNYLEKTVIPVVNNNGEAVKELANLYNTLKEYVDNYFNNLDIQEEINKKLDEMAESGQLTDIIAQYLQLAGILSFNTLDDLINAENLVKGSSVRTLGEKFINDGNGSYYKIDDEAYEDYIELENGLYAIKVNSSKFPNFFLSMYFESSSPYKDEMFVSLDGINHTKLKTSFNLQGRDCCIRYNPLNKMFYMTTGALDLQNFDFTIYYSSDFKNWDYKQINMGLQGSLKWAPDLFIDDDGSMYVVISNNYDTEVDISGNTINAFDLYITKCTNLENLTFNQSTRLVLNGATHRNHIDGSICKINNNYYLVCKDEYNKINEIYSSLDLINYYIVNENITNSSLWIEGCQLLKVDNDIYYIGEVYSRNRHIISKTSIDNFPNFTKFETVENLQGYKHGSMIYIQDEYVKNIIRTSCQDFSFCNNQELNQKVFNRVNISAGVDDFIKNGLAILPNTVYYASGSGTINLNIVNPFEVDVMRFYFAGNNSLKLVINSLDGTSTNFEITNSRFLNEKLIEIPLKYNSLKFMSGTIEQLTSSDAVISRPNDFSWNWFHAYKVNGMVNITLNLKCISSDYSSGVWFDLTTLPSGWRPADIMQFVNGNQALGCRMTINSNGVINCYIKLDQNASNPFSISYIAIN